MKNEAKTMGLEISRGNAKETDKPQSGKQQLVEYFPVKDTPFTVAKNGNEWFVLMGKYRLTENLTTKSKGLS